MPTRLAIFTPVNHSQPPQIFLKLFLSYRDVVDQGLSHWNSICFPCPTQQKQWNNDATMNIGLYSHLKSDLSLLLRHKSAIAAVVIGQCCSGASLRPAEGSETGSRSNLLRLSWSGAQPH